MVCFLSLVPSVWCFTVPMSSEYTTQCRCMCSVVSAKHKRHTLLQSGQCHLPWGMLRMRYSIYEMSTFHFHRQYLSIFFISVITPTAVECLTLVRSMAARFLPTCTFLLITHPALNNEVVSIQTLVSLTLCSNYHQLALPPSLPPLLSCKFFTELQYKMLPNTMKDGLTSLVVSCMYQST